MHQSVVVFETSPNVGWEVGETPGVLLGFLVDPEHEAYQELAVAKDPDQESEVRARVNQGLQAVDRVPHCKTLHLVIGLPRAVVVPGTNDLLAIAIQYDECSHSQSVLCSPIELHMHRLTQCKACFGWEVRWLLERHLIHCHVVQQLVHHPFLQSQCQLLVHLQLLWRGTSLVN